MSRTRIVKGKITEVTGGTSKIFGNSIKINSGGSIDYYAKNYTYGEPEQPPKKAVFLEEPIALAVVYFRPLEKEWKGEYGFDWLREKDNGYNLEPPYKDIIEGGYKDGVNNLNKEEAYEQLKTEYKSIDISLKEKEVAETNSGIPEKYYVPYLTLFSEQFVEALSKKMPEMLVKPCFEAELRMLLYIDEDLEKLEFDYNRDFFQLSYDQLAESKKNMGLKPAEKTIKIKCLKDLDQYKEICIYAYPKDKSNTDKKLAGKIIVLKNDSTVRKEEKIVLVEVKTDVGKKLKKGEKNGEFSLEEKQYLYKTLYQALIVPVVEETILDLRKNADFQIGGKHINIIDKNVKLFYRDNENELQKYLNVYKDCTTLFFDEKDDKGIKLNLKYEEYFTIFKFGIASNESAVVGAVEKIWVRNVIMLTTSKKDNCTLCHETMHGLGLRHIHHPSKEAIIYSSCKYTYPSGEFMSHYATNNVMAYIDNDAFSSWKWQWEIINPNIKKLCEI
ncbi:hypothetical protein ACFFLS_13400 [Flavobacterium procerum]|uniref:Uncharacterized protein n=1 Tax=Flavobacterium procerum TaxID=1455569 RepID=A0ABV6BTS8_9FLAO